MKKNLFLRLSVGDIIFGGDYPGNFKVVEKFNGGNTIEISQLKIIKDSTLKKWSTVNNQPITRSSLERGTQVKRKSTGQIYIVDLVALEHASCSFMQEVSEADAREWHLYSPRDTHD